MQPDIPSLHLTVELAGHLYYPAHIVAQIPNHLVFSV